MGSELASYRLPPPELARLKEAERASSRRSSTPWSRGRTARIDRIALPYRALLGPSRTVPHFSGTPWARFKTSTACVPARFFAPGLEYSDTMPLSWSSTQAGLERLRYVAKDSLLPIDNLIADGDQAHRDLAKADSVINSQGDLAGKARMRADAVTPKARTARMDHLDR